jgi:O-antigen ligase
MRDVHEARWDALTSNRLGPWAAAVEMARARPIAGFGPGTFEAEFVPHRMRAEMRHRTRLVTPVLTSSYGETHCEPLQAVAEWGLPAGTAATAAVLLLVLLTVARARHSQDDEGLVLAGVLVAAAVAALTWFPFQQASTTAPVLVALGRAWRRLG